MAQQHISASLEHNSSSASPLSRPLGMGTGQAQGHNKDLSSKGLTDTRDAHISSKTRKPNNINSLPGELLIQILSEVPRENRVSIRSVSKRWSCIIRDIGYHLEPLFVLDNNSGIPHYTKDCTLKQNPTIRSIGYSLLDLETSASRIRLFTGTELLLRRSEFITSPPISMAAVYIWKGNVLHPDLTFVQAVIRTATPALKGSEGIRIGDLMDVVESIKRDIPGESRIEDIKVWYAAEEESRAEFEVREAASGMGKIEVRSRIFQDSFGYDAS